MYSYLTFKATRTPRLVKAGLGLKDAIEQATMFYDHSKILNDHELLVNGVSILVMEDAVAEKAVADGHLINIPAEHIDYQCGGY
jgi:hypothetical protein